MCELLELKTNLNTDIKVSEYKYDQIRNLISLASLCKEIRQIILFGSSLCDTCSEDSDIDFVIISDLSVLQLSKKKTFKSFLEKLYLSDDFKTEYDILYFNSLEEIYSNQEDWICSEIANKGELIYDSKGAAA